MSSTSRKSKKKSRMIASERVISGDLVILLGAGIRVEQARCRADGQICIVLSVDSLGNDSLWGSRRVIDFQGDLMAIDCTVIPRSTFTNFWIKSLSYDERRDGHS